MRRKKNFWKEAVQSAREAVVIDSSIEITSNRQAVVRGAKGILEYEEEQIRVALMECEVCFWGRRLTIDCLSQDSLEIRGEIERIEYR